VLQETPDNEEIIERVAALVDGKAELVCCARSPSEDKPGRRMQETATWIALAAGRRPLLDSNQRTRLRRPVLYPLS
jgi:hypothetical protein